MDRGDSDGEDAMAYFLPNGIADDSPPKRSTLGQSGFGSIGGRFGGPSLAPMASLDLSSPSSLSSQPRSAPLYGNLLAAPATPNGLSISSSSTSRSPFSLSDLGGEIHRPQSSDLGNAIGNGMRNPFSFGGAFASLSSESLGRSSSSLFGSTHCDTTTSTPTASSAFRSDADFYSAAPSNSSSLGANSMQSRPTLNANAPAFMSSSSPASTHEALSYGSGSPSTWSPATTTTMAKPRRAPPGLSKPSEASPASMKSRTSEESGTTTRSHPPGLARPSQAAPFSGYSTASTSSTTSIFSSSSSPFASSLQPQYASFLTGSTLNSETGFKSALSELNAKSMAVEEIQSNNLLEATAFAAAQDVVSGQSKRKERTAGDSTPRGASKRGENGRGKSSPQFTDEKNNAVRSSPDPRLRTPTRRNENMSMSSSASPSTSGRLDDRRGRHARVPPVSDSAIRSYDGLATPESDVKSGRRTRGGGIYAALDARHASRSYTSTEAMSGGGNQPLTRKKPPSSVSSGGSDDQLLSISTLLVDVAEENVVASRIDRAKGSPHDSRNASRNAKTKKSSPAAQNTEKRGPTRRQVYREKHAAREQEKLEISGATDSAKASGTSSDADASAGDSPTDDAVGERSEEMKTVAPASEVPRTPTKADTRQPKHATPGARLEEPTDTGKIAIKTAKSPSHKRQQVVLPKSPIQAEPNAASASSPVLDRQIDSLNVDTDAPMDRKHTSNHSSPINASPVGAVGSPTHSPKNVATAAPDTPSHVESDSGSEIPEAVSRSSVRHATSSDRKTSSKDHKKEKHKKKPTTAAKPTKKEKRDSSSSGKGDLLGSEEPLFASPPAKKLLPSFAATATATFQKARVMTKRGFVSVWSTLWFMCTEFADLINLKGVLVWAFSYLESILAVLFSVILLLSLHGASWFIRIHRVAFRAVLTHRHVGFCFAFMYAFPFLVQYVFPWAPPWAPVCLWYAFLVQLFCTNGPAAMVATFRVILPLVFLVEGISHHSFLLDLNGAELLLAAFILSAMKMSNLCSPIFMISFAIQSLSAVFIGSELVVQWFQLALALYSLHAMAATEDDWAGLGDEEYDVSCRPMPMHHSIADYNYYPAPSVPAIQKSKRLDRRALAYVRGRKIR